MNKPTQKRSYNTYICIYIMVAEEFQIFMNKNSRNSDITSIS